MASTQAMPSHTTPPQGLQQASVIAILLLGVKLGKGWHPVGEGWHPVVSGKKAGLFPHLAEEREGAWQMVSRAAPAPRSWVAVICHPQLTLPVVFLGWQHPPCSPASQPSDLYRQRALRLGFILLTALDFELAFSFCCMKKF